jgi:two-component system response regulator AlgR
MGASKFSVVVIGDEPLALEDTRRLCAASGKVEIVGEAADGKSGLALVSATRPEAVFLDITMPDRSGLGIAAELKARPDPPCIVLVAAHDKFAAQAFDLAVVDYVLKPIVPERLLRAIDRVAALLAINGDEKSVGTLWLPHRGSVLRLSASEIHRLESERDYVRFFSTNRSFLLRVTLTDMQARLDPARFVRIHRSTIIAVDRIAGVRHVGAGAWVVLDLDGAHLSIGRSYLEGVRSRLGLD